MDDYKKRIFIRPRVPAGIVVASAIRTWEEHANCDTPVSEPPQRSQLSVDSNFGSSDLLGGKKYRLRGVRFGPRKLGPPARTQCYPARGKA